MGAIEAKEAASFKHATNLTVDRAAKGYYAREDLDGYTGMRKHYGVIQSKKLDKELLVAVASTLKGDGLIDIEEVKTVVFPQVADGRGGKPELTCNERWTLRYCIAEFKFNEDARHFMFDALKSDIKIMDMDDRHLTDPAKIEAVIKGPTLEELGGEPAAKKARTENGTDELVQVDGMMLDKGMLLATRSASSEDGVIDALEAVQIFKEAADGGGLNINERWTFRFILGGYMFTDAAYNFLLEALHKCEKQ